MQEMLVQVAKIIIVDVLGEDTSSFRNIIMNLTWELRKQATADQSDQPNTKQQELSNLCDLKLY